MPKNTVYLVFIHDPETGFENPVKAFWSKLDAKLAGEKRCARKGRVFEWRELRGRLGLFALGEGQFLPTAWTHELGVKRRDAWLGISISTFTVE